MNPADFEPDPQVTNILHAISNQGVLLEQHDQPLRGIMGTLSDLAEGLARVEKQLQVPPSPAAVLDPAPTAPLGPLHPGEPYVTAPERYEGKLGDCKSFLFQCSLVFELQRLTYVNDRATIADVLGLLTGRARSWGTAFWHSSQNANATFAEFSAEMSSIFDHPVASSDASNHLLSLRQGPLSAANYSVEFRTLATELGWDDKALQSISLKGLNEEVKDSLVGRAETADLQGLIALAIKVDNRLRERRIERLSGPQAGFGEATTSRLSSRPPEGMSTDTNTAFSSSRSKEPMQLGWNRLTPTERDRRFRGGLCLYCGESGHRLATCPQRLNPKGSPVTDW